MSLDISRSMNLPCITVCPGDYRPSRVTAPHLSGQEPMVIDMVARTGAAAA